MTAFLRGFVHAARGVALGSHGRNFRVMLVIAAAVAGLTWWVGLAAPRAALVLACMGFVLSLELVNTAGEMLVDLGPV